MKLLSALLCILIPAAVAIAGDPQIICDDETGICRIVDPGNIPENESLRESQPTVLRRHTGTADKAEFLNFLKGENTGDPGNSVTFWGILLIAFLGGIALNLTPCVLPMLPVNLAIIGASGGGRQGFRRGLLYGIGMAAAYGTLGILAAFAGMTFGVLNSSPLFNFAIAAIFIILSLAMAGVFHIDPASGFHINPHSLKLSGDAAALVMGAVSAVLAGACVAPVVISVLIFAADSGWYGCFVPFALGIGMALPWPLAGAGLAVLPKPGKFMVILKYIFAVIIFGAAVYYTVTGIKLLPSDEISESENGFAALESAIAESEISGKPVLVKFTASWCKNCHAMEKEVLSDREIKDFIAENFISVTFPAENPAEPAVAALLEKYDVPGFPAFVILAVQ